MDFCIDTEFIACEKQRRFLGLPIGRPVPTIDLISIALVAADGRELYLLNADCELQYAWADEWVRTNVLLPIWREQISGNMRNHVNFSLAVMRDIFRKKGLSRGMLKWHVLMFVHAAAYEKHVGTMDSFFEGDFTDTHRFFGYYCDYDWVVFCQLFGAMTELPKGFPQFCSDLHQERLALGISDDEKRAMCPDPVNEHSALADARWNRDLKLALNKYSFRRP